MNRAQLEHIIRAASIISGEDVIMIVGSQSILGQFPDAPAELCVSVEADVYPKSRPELSDLIDGSIGEGSPFHQTFGYYAQGVDHTTATLPHGFESRLIPISSAATRGATGLCLEAHDLVISKLVAGREKDKVFAAAAARHGMIDESRLRARLAETDLEPRLRNAVSVRITRVFDEHASDE